MFVLLDGEGRRCRCSRFEDSGVGVVFIVFGGVNLVRVQSELARLGPVRFGSVRLGSALLCSVRFGSVRFGSVRFGSARLGSARLGSALFPFGSARVG